MGISEVPARAAQPAQPGEGDLDRAGAQLFGHGEDRVEYGGALVTALTDRAVGRGPRAESSLLALPVLPGQQAAYQR